jgi:hypothetical protein
MDNLELDLVFLKFFQSTLTKPTIFNLEPQDMHLYTSYNEIMTNVHFLGFIQRIAKSNR